MRPPTKIKRPCIAVASFTKQVNPRLTKRPLKTNGRLANLGLTSLVKEATGIELVSTEYQAQLRPYVLG